MKTKGYALSVIGSRESNQDAFLIDDKKQIYAVADGVGGGVKGDVASAIATVNLRQFAESGKLADGFKELQKLVIKEAMDTVGTPTMGTTLSAAFIHGDKLEICHVGDSHIYFYEGTHLNLLTEDQEFYDESVNAPVLGSYLGIPEDLYPLEIFETTKTLKVGDKLLLCSDGLYRQMSEPRIVEIMNAFLDNPEEMLRALCTEAAQADYSDNITVVFVEVLPD